MLLEARTARFSVRECPACGDARQEQLLTLPARLFCEANATYRRDYSKTLRVDPGETFPVVTCVRCRFVFAGLLPEQTFLDDLYEEVIDPEIGFRESTALTWTSHLLNLGSRLLDVLARKSLEGRARVLDFGCGYGTLLKAIEGPRVTAFGFETSPRRVRYMRGLGLTVLETLEAVQRQAPFDAVVLSDVLEHVPDPMGTLRAVNRMLHIGGILLIRVPDFNDRMWAGVLADLRRGRSPSREVNPWEHLNYFSPASLTRLLKDTDYDLLESVQKPAFGLRRDGNSRQRIVNGVESFMRFVLAVIGRPEPTTTVLAVRRPVEPDGAIAAPVG
jgi:SAM-dependent methyltransferase